MTPRTPHVAVVGGGVAGLAAVRALRAAGARVTLLEGSQRLGGKLLTSEVAGVPVDAGAESFLFRQPAAVELAREVGLAQDLVHPAAGGASLWSRGRLRALPPRTLMGIPADLRPVAASGVLSPAGLARTALDPVLPGHAPDGDVAVGAYVGRRLGRDVVERLVDPLLGGVYAGRAAELSLRATVPQLVPHLSAHRSLVAAARAAMTPPPGTAAPTGPVFATVRGGLGRLIAALDPGDAVLGRPVRALSRTPDGWRLVHGATRDEQALEADGVVLAVPGAPASRLLADVAPVAASALAGIGYASVALVTLAYRRTAPLPASSGYLIPAVEQRPVKAATFFSAKWPHVGGAAPDVFLVRCSFGRFGDTADLQRDDEELVALARAELRLSLGRDDAPVDARVTRWGGALPQYAVGHLDRVTRIRAAVAAQPALAVAGAAYDGVGIPACIRSAQRAAAEVLAALTGSGTP